MEDLDQPRTRPGSAEKILSDLRWMGLDWDEGPDIGGPNGPYTQSERSQLYEQGLNCLKEQGLVFPCYCSRKDILEASSAPHGVTPIYPGTCRSLTVPEQQRSSGRVPAWRYLAQDETIKFGDEIAGEITQNLMGEVGDFVVRRSDRLFAYQLAVVVDDAMMGITDVVRGSDLIDSTPRQITLFRALGFEVPRFWHVPLMQDENGNRMSKRDGSDSIDSFRDAGGTAQKLVGQLVASVGLIEPNREVTPAQLLKLHDIESFKTCITRVISAS